MGNKLSTHFTVGRADTTTPLRLPGMIRESTVKQLKTELGQTEMAIRKPPAKPKNLPTTKVPYKNTMTKIKFGI